MTERRPRKCLTHSHRLLFIFRWDAWKKKRQWLNHTEGSVVLFTLLIVGSTLDRWALALVSFVLVLALPSVPGAGCLSNSPAWPSAWSQPAGPSCQLLLPPPMGGGGQAARNGSPVVSSLHTLWPAERRGSLDAHEWTPTGIAPRLSHPKEGAGSAWWKSEQEASTQSPGQTIVPDKLLPLCRLGPYRRNKWNQMTTKTSTKEPQNPMTWGGRKLRSWHLVPSLHGK